jgi:hypothetical protein
MKAVIRQKPTTPMVNINPGMGVGKRTWTRTEIGRAGGYEPRRRFLFIEGKDKVSAMVAVQLTHSAN